jgi:signal transduction histidine kinase
VASATGSASDEAVNPLRSVGLKLSLALVILVAGALGVVYAIVIPSLERNLVNARLDSLRAVAPELGRSAPTSPFEDWGIFLDTASSTANARVVVYDTLVVGEAPILSVVEDSHSVTSADVQNDRIAVAAARDFQRASGTVTRRGTRFAEVAVPIAPPGRVLLLSSSLEDALANVDTVQRRVLEAGALALLAALIVGYGLAYVFARRIRRLEAAAEGIADGHFDRPIEDRSGDELGQLARAFDRMRLRLAQLERARREFIGNASHELRTPLFSLRGFIELLTDEELDEATRREFLETMAEQVDRLQRLAEDLLDLTRLDAGQLRVDRRDVDLAELAQDLAEEFRAVARASGHRLDVLAAPAEALGDEERILRIGRALIENALRHTPSGTPIRVRSSPAAFGTTMLVVEDEGPGIAAEHARHVFERFYRADGAHASGSGLGLAIAHELAEAMGGVLELDSRSGRTAFTLRLPAPVDEREETPAPAIA